jgi:DUF1680 family protein
MTFPVVQASGFLVAPSLPRTRANLIAIPYYAWANREPGAMRVWIPRAHA